MNLVTKTFAIVAAIILALHIDPAGAQDPVLPLPATPEPTECTVTPRSVEELRQLAASAATAIGSPVSESVASTPFAIPDGEPADEAVTRAVTASIRQSLACLNAGDIRAAQALATDDAVRREIAQLAVALDSVGGIDALLNDPALAASPVAAPPSLRGALVSVDGVTILGDGRVGAVVEVDALLTPGATQASETRQDYYILRRVDGRYLIDEQILGIGQAGLGGDGPPPEGTPAS